MLDKKPIQAIFLFKFKMGHNTVETTHNSNNAFGPGAVTKVQCGGGSWSFAKMTRALEMRSAVGPIRSWQWLVLRGIIKADPFTTTQEVAQQLKIDHSMVIRHLKQIGKVKKLAKWVPHELTKNQKIVVLKCCVLFFYTTMNHFLIGLWHVMKSGFYNRRCPSQWLDQEEAPKHFWKPHLDQNKVMVTVWWPAAHHYSFLNPSEIVISEKCAQRINEMYRKLQCLQLTCNWSTKWPVTGQQKEPSFSPWQCLTTHCITSFKSSMNGATRFGLVHHIHLTSHQPTTTALKHLKNHFQAKCFHSKQEEENAFQEFLESWSMGFYATGINKHFSLAKMYWL